jgi:molecular chaperone IbpA
MTTLNYNLMRSIIGWDPSFLEEEAFEQHFPPYNLYEIEENKIKLDMALAGYNKDKIEVTVKDSILCVSTKKINKDLKEKSFIHRGIAERNFERKFKLAEFMEVTDAKMEDGLLQIILERIVPEEQKPKSIEIK